MISFFVFLFILGLLIIVHEFGHFVAAKKLGIKIERFSLGFGPQIFLKKKQDTEYCVSAVPLGGYVKLAGDCVEEYKGRPYEYLSKPVGKRFWVIFSGPLFNYVLGILFFGIIFFVGYPTPTTKVGGLLDGFGAKAAGIQIGDRILAVDGQRVDYWEDLQKIIQSKREAERVLLSVLREGKVYSIEVNIKEKKIDDVLGRKRSIGLLGITPSEEVVKLRHGFFLSFLLGIKKAWNLTALTYQALWRMSTGQLSVRESISGPLGIFFITSKVAHQGIIILMHFIAVLSISLAIFNLLPLPVLDGGHIILLLIEKMRGRMLTAKEERIISRIGVTLIIFLALFVTYNDLNRLFADRIIKFFK
ncbi:MAG: RIP metalloprotease RseP [Candidatus Omnitrophica bacterium]|nr:RIP metalloprotease RseP [Candidatus Omnitrophota bacterium]